jgi:phosphopantetheinyl transferase
LARGGGGGRQAFFTLWSQKEALLKALGCGWADGRIQRRTALVTDGFQVEPATGARVWSRRVKGGEYALAVALLGQSENTSAVNT